MRPPRSGHIAPQGGHDLGAGAQVCPGEKVVVLASAETGSRLSARATVRSPAKILFLISSFLLVVVGEYFFSLA